MADKELAGALASLRLHLRISGTQMAKHIDVDRATIWRYEMGQHNFGLEVLARLARVAMDSKRHDLALVFLAPVSARLGLNMQSLLDGIRRAA